MASIRQDHKSGSWFVDFRRGTSRKRVHFPTKRESEEFKRSLLLRGYKGADSEAEIPPVLLSEAVERYLEAITATKAKGTQYFERIVFKSLLEYFPGYHLTDLRLPEIQEYQSHLRKSKLGQSVNRRFTTLCHFFRSCVDWNLIKDNPAERLRKLPASKQRAKRALSVEELSKVLSAAKPWLRDILWFILVCGVRRSQATYLRWGAIDFRGKYIHLESSEGFDNKDYETNTLPMTEATEQFLRVVHEEARRRRQATDDDFVFVDDRALPIRPDRLTKEAKRLLNQVLDLQSGAVHILRHTSLTLRHRQGASLDAVRAIAGHSNIKTTMLYLHSEPEHLREIMTKTPLLAPFWLSIIERGVGI